MSDLKLNGSLRPEILIVGDERTPVIVIDEPILNPEELRQEACQRGKFDVDGRFAYPGVRADLPVDYAASLLPELLTLLYDVYKIPASFKHQLIHQLFSLITREPESLAPLQRVPHFDSLSPYYFATVHYLSPGSYAGTGIFRHRPTGYERITDSRFQDYVRAAEAHMKANGLPATEYINSSNDHYELVAEIEYRSNRLVMYPGNVLHSGLVKPSRDIDSDPATGRLTANLFLNFSEQAPQ